jgi:hypothetical protein
MPFAEAKFAEFAEVFTEAAEDLADALGIPADVATKQKGQFTAYKAAFTACESPNAGAVDREDRKEKRDALSRRNEKGELGPSSPIQSMTIV